MTRQVLSRRFPILSQDQSFALKVQPSTPSAAPHNPPRLDWKEPPQRSENSLYQLNHEAELRSLQAETAALLQHLQTIQAQRLVAQADLDSRKANS
jgi:hypothetical protein